MKALTQKHKQCHCRNRSVKAGEWAQAKKHPIFILDDRLPATGPYPCFLLSSLSPPSGLLPVSLQTVGTDGIINKHDNWKDHAKPILFVPDDLRKLRKHSGKCLINSEPRNMCACLGYLFPGSAPMKMMSEGDAGP